jgi:hypothetical protein
LTLFTPRRVHRQIVLASGRLPNWRMNSLDIRVPMQ